MKVQNIAVILFICLHLTILGQEKVNPSDKAAIKTSVKLVLSESNKKTFLSVEPGCGYYQLKLLLKDEKQKLYIVEKSLGAPIDNKGKLDTKGIGLIGYYLISFKEENKPNKITLLKKA